MPVDVNEVKAIIVILVTKNAVDVRKTDQTVTVHE